MLRIALFAWVLLALFEFSPAFARDLGCIGTHHVRQFGTAGSNPGDEWETTHYRFRNYNDDRTLTIQRIEIFADDGTLLRAFAGTDWPPEFNPVLGPNQSSGFELRDVFGDVDAPGGNFLQTVVTWNRARPVTTPLQVIAARVTRARGGGGGQRETRARAILPCLTLR